MKAEEIKSDLLPTAMRLGLSVGLVGGAGVGKTSVLTWYATHVMKSWNYLFPIPAVSELEAKGLPNKGKNPVLGEVTTFLPGFIIDACWKLYDEHKKPGMLILDEVGSGKPAVQSVLREAAQNFVIGGYKLPPGTFLTYTLNRQKDHANVYKLDAPLANRGFVVSFEPTLQDWTDWGMSEADPTLHPWILAFHRFHDGADLNTYDPSIYGIEDKYSFGSNRSWYNVSKVFTDAENMRKRFPNEMIVSGLIGRELTSKLYAYMEVAHEMPDREEVEKHPEKAKIPEPDNLGALHAVACVVGGWADKANMGAILTYAERLPRSFMTGMVTDISKRDPLGIIQHPFFKKWLEKNGTDITKLTSQ